MIDVVPHSEQRYDTVGDWMIRDDKLFITVSELPENHHEWAVAIHELVEALLCHKEGVTQEQVDDWDIHGDGKDLDEPGEAFEAPYHFQHICARGLERRFIQMCNDTWTNYESKIKEIK